LIRERCGYLLTAEHNGVGDARVDRLVEGAGTLMGKVKTTGIGPAT
jgi:hypothetical protein